ncbi:helix-turn-helix domain-containing protein [Chromobacterium sp. IIBBL 290-4]|uniref:helix-turn-helix domain-containing protein n=1 Tax=Chromobacterium sp. IIBBL 290-4 TaxID=2953890 RepID=UPI0020B80BF9|nr:helix-turn-helix domain-containing protein [Chromobacterium sp. IIBBL 290-4]UTH73136.1 helix-turn-helix domain-containing protein [Chromobacterium sp. IIBBL 290-4]
MTSPKNANEIICDNIRQQLEQFQWPEAQQAGLVEQILGLSTSQAYRKLNGSSPWQISQVERLAQYFNTPVSGLLVDHSQQAHAQQNENELIPAILHLTSQSGEAHCWVQLGDSLEDDSCAPLLMAKRLHDCWHVFPGTQFSGEDGYEVTYLTIRPPKRANTKRLLVAVLDDKDADLLSAILVQQGLFALPYSHPQMLLQALRHEEFDAFVLDWVLGADTNCMEIIQIIRSQFPTVPIIVLTGYALEHEAELSQALQTHNVYYIGKPTPGSILALQIKNMVTNAIEQTPA